VLRYDGSTGAFLDVFVPSFRGGLNGAYNLAFGPDDNLYVLSIQNDRILRYNGSTGAFIDTFAVGIDLPFDLVFAPTGDLFVTSEFGNSVLRYNASGASFAVPPRSGLTAPLGVGIGSDGNLYVATGNSGVSTANSILRYDATTGAFLDVFVPAGSGGLGTPNPVLFGPDGNLYVGSNYAHPPDQAGTNTTVLRYDGRTGAFLDTFVAPASGGLDGASNLIFTPHPVIPEPATLVVFGIGYLRLTVYGRRRSRNRPVAPSHPPAPLPCGGLFCRPVRQRP
jgi:glucose/arabinose dehydrogenase